MSRTPKSMQDSPIVQQPSSATTNLSKRSTKSNSLNSSKLDTPTVPIVDAAPMKTQLSPTVEKVLPDANVLDLEQMVLSTSTEPRPDSKSWMNADSMNVQHHVAFNRARSKSNMSPGGVPELQPGVKSLPELDAILAATLFKSDTKRGTPKRKRQKHELPDLDAASRTGNSSTKVNINTPLQHSRQKKTPAAETSHRESKVMMVNICCMLNGMFALLFASMLTCKI